MRTISKIQPQLLITILIIVSCAHEAPRFDSSENLFAHINELAAQEDAVVVLYSSSRNPASNLIVTSDSAIWIDPNTGNRKSIPTSEIAQVEFNNHGAGLVKGCGAGVVIGGLAGYTIGLLSMEKSSEEDMFSELVRGTGIALCALGGGVLGATSGGISGQIDIYPIEIDNLSK